MASLQDQLLKAGLVDGKQAKQADKDKRKQNKVQKKSGQPALDATKLAAQQAQADKAERDRALNAQRDAEAKQKAIRAQIVQLAKQHQQSKGGGDIAYNFTFQKKIKKIHVSAEVQAHLIAGRLVLVCLDDAVYLVPRVVADKIAERDAAPLVRVPASESTVVEDDPYKDYVIPDDLMW